MNLNKNLCIFFARSRAMISMELPPAVHLQHLNHGHGLPSSQHHHSGLMQHQHQTCLSSIPDEKQKNDGSQSSMNGDVTIAVL
ncbi:hypothetical protein Bhyg_05950 [Pseudolycoriella hygida]|uniref:Uncharacterized protein n=1 Tax=Pseudolycoriella hygida TaxID=35572 RepID=A0A9Q0MZP4_9DIPT|nr:hypothetical protein Bhyg_05950 [Pseudolycoriella hygida]